MHGYGANKESFLPQIRYFSRFYRVTAFDFWGFGQSEGLPSAWSVGDYAQQTAELLKELNVVRPCVVAHSFGARVAVKLASQNPQIFEKMLLTGAAGVVANRGLGYHVKVRAYRFIKKLFPVYAERHFGSAEYKRLSPVMKESYKKIVNEDLRACARHVQIPVLFVYGDKDTTTPVKEGKLYSAAILGSRLEILPHCGHFAFLDDAPLFNQITEEFLESENV